MNNLNDDYRTLLLPLTRHEGLTRISHEGHTHRSSNERTGVEVIQHLKPQVLSVPIHRLCVPCPRWRRLSPHIPMAETIWQLMGTEDLKWLNGYAPHVWKPYALEGTL